MAQATGCGMGTACTAGSTLAQPSHTTAAARKRLRPAKSFCIAATVSSARWRLAPCSLSRMTYSASP
eukprot:9787924-Lingulodinium_polyedra.AAC.1